MSIQSQVERYSSIDPTSYKIGSLAEAVGLTSGLVFIFAEWSGVATRGWRVLTAVLAELDKLPPIWVIDADGLQPDATMKLLNELPQGKGEVYWIKNGMIISKQSSLCEADRATILENISLLESEI